MKNLLAIISISLGILSTETIQAQNVAPSFCELGLSVNANGNNPRIKYLVNCYQSTDDKSLNKTEIPITLSEDLLDSINKLGGQVLEENAISTTWKLNYIVQRTTLSDLFITIEQEWIRLLGLFASEYNLTPTSTCSSEKPSSVFVGKCLLSKK